MRGASKGDYVSRRARAAITDGGDKASGKAAVSQAHLIHIKRRGLRGETLTQSTNHNKALFL